MTGEIVSHYEILEKLGEGGMGVVYKARDIRLKRLVALKFLPPHITATEERIARFEAEARAISALNHPHIATIYSMEEDAGRRFIVLEFLPGGTLRERLDKCHERSEPFPWRDAVSLAIDMAKGLGHAHRNGIVHRDLKPENVMFTDEGLLRITDFGLAKTAGSAGLTQTGATVGTAAYMAPEQATGNMTSARSDLFSLGIILHEIIAGKRPFEGASHFATMTALVHNPPPPLRSFRSDVPPSVERIVLRLLEKDPARRYQTGEAVAADLAEVVDTHAGKATSDSATKTMVSSVVVRRRSPIVLLAVIVLALIAITAGWYRLRSRRGIQANTQLVVLPFTARSGRAEDVAFGAGLSAIVAARLASVNFWVVPESDLERNHVTTPTEARLFFGIPLALTGVIEKQASGEARVDMRLVDTASNRAIRSASAASASWSLQEEVIRQAAAMLGVSLAPADPGKSRGESSRAPNAYDFYVEGNGYLQRYDQTGNIASAIVSFQKAIQLDPSYALAYAGLSGAYWRQYRYSTQQQYLELARDSAMQALSRNESLDSPHITLGAIAVSAGQVEEGIRQLRIALERDPVNAEACRELANAYVAAGKLTEAEATYKRAIQYRPNFWLGYSDLAIFYNENARYEQAEAALQKAASLTPDNYLVFRNLGGVQTERGEWNEAERSLRRALALRPGGSVYSSLGALYILAGRYGDAVPVLEKAAGLSEGERNAYIIWGNLGDAYRWTPQRRNDAAKAYSRAIQLAEARLAASPGDSGLQSQIALYYAKRGDRGPAAENIRQALKAAPKTPSILFRRAIVLELGGDRKESLRALDAALSGGYALKLVETEPELASLRSDPGYAIVAGHAKEQK